LSDRKTKVPSPRPAHLVEAVLLVSANPLSSSDLCSATGLSEAELERALACLRERYAREASGIVLREVAGGYLLSTNPACSAAVERFRREARPAPLSGAAHEALAGALYLGPLSRVRERLAPPGTGQSEVGTEAP